MLLPEKTPSYNDGMTWLVNGREFANVTRLEPSARYEYFVKRVADWQELWGLWKDGWATMGDSEAGELVPVWPHRIYAEALAHDDWLGYAPKNISLSDWMEKMDSRHDSRKPKRRRISRH